MTQTEVSGSLIQSMASKLQELRNEVFMLKKLNSDIISRKFDKAYFQDNDDRVKYVLYWAYFLFRSTCFVYLP